MRWSEQINPETGRVHTSFAMARLPPGGFLDRSQSAEHPDPHRGRPQNPPRLRRRAGHLLISADYSQIELRLAAHVAEIAPLKARSATATTSTRMTASEVFGVPIGHGPETRRRAKAINFGIIYGISAFGLAQQLGIPRPRRAIHQGLFRPLPRHPRLYGARPRN